MKSHLKIIFTGSLAVLFILACFSYMLSIETPRPITLKDDLKSEEVIFFGVISRYSPKQIIRGYQPLMDYLSEATPYKFELRLSRSYMETVDQLVEEKVSFASLGNFTYVHANLDHGVRCIAMPLNEIGSSENYDAFIVLEDSPIQTVTDLRMKSLAMASRFSFSAWMAIWMLEEEGISTKDLAAYTHLDHHDQVAEKVLRGEYDAGMVKAVVARKYEGKGLRVLAISPSIPSVPLVAGPQVPNEKIGIVQKALIALQDEIESGRVNTQAWDDEIKHGYTEGNDESYDYTRQVLKKLGAWE